jgi:hypothetical protein
VIGLDIVDEMLCVPRQSARGRIAELWFSPSFVDLRAVMRSIFPSPMRASTLRHRIVSSTSFTTQT